MANFPDNIENFLTENQSTQFSPTGLLMVYALRPLLLLDPSQHLFSFLSYGCWSASNGFFLKIYTSPHCRTLSVVNSPCAHSWYLSPPPPAVVSFFAQRTQNVSLFGQFGLFCCKFMHFLVLLLQGFTANVRYDCCQFQLNKEYKSRSSVSLRWTHIIDLNAKILFALSSFIKRTS